MSSSRSSSHHVAGVRYSLPQLGAGWELPEQTMPESVLHDEAVSLLKALLAAWAAQRSDAFVARNLAVRWDESHPQIGVDPDVCVLSPAPPDPSELKSVRTWLADHEPPLLAIEVVSESNPHKDYAVAPDKYAACGVSELWIFDPLLAGPRAHGGPFRLQIWHRGDDGVLVRGYAGEGPARSTVLGAFLVVTAEGRKLRIADDEAATRFWLTAEEREREAKEQERKAKEQERKAKEQEREAKEQEREAKEAALARVAELEAALDREKARR
ncbi:MAG: Uma2 family endonuclease [Labilithrix sp.]|nr:Uma2 family endonuclease [Labilithrix sp.]